MKLEVLAVLLDFPRRGRRSCWINTGGDARRVDELDDGELDPDEFLGANELLVLLVLVVLLVVSWMSPSMIRLPPGG